MTDRCERCNGQGTLEKCLQCGVIFRHIHKYSDCGSIGCDGEGSETIPCPDCSCHTPCYRPWCGVGGKFCIECIDAAKKG